MLSPDFERRMQAFLGPEYPDFAAALEAPASVSIRFNPFKPSDGNEPPLTPVPWHPQAFYLTERPVFTLDPLFHAGAYYVQEASSMFLYEALRQTVDFSKNLNVLDLCAAPGGKSTLLASMLSAGSLLVANEVVRQRLGPLRENLEKWGIPNMAVACAAPEDFAGLEGWFDVVVVDAPCSGEGLFRKDPDAIGEWSPEQVDRCALRQRQILPAAAAALAPGGVLAYSTCTFNRAENEENAAWLAHNFDLEPLQPGIPAGWGIAASEPGYRFYPHRLQGEGFYIALFRKKENPRPLASASTGFRSLQPLPKKLLPELKGWLRADWDVLFFQTPGGEILALPASLEPGFRVLDKVLKNKWFGANIGQFKGLDFIPSHALALSILLHPDLPRVALGREQALRFLKKEVFDLPPERPASGWALACYAGLPLGWMKILRDRWNNYLPNERRIRMDIA
ncbi:MAG: RNA methyltransferase [Saprospirales bacterium]|nr:RNA methyltransferase [Saprospirales bacterium]